MPEQPRRSRRGTETRQRTKLVNLRLTPAEDVDLRACAAAEGLPIPTYMRRRVFALVHVGWMLPPDLAARFDVTPLDDDYLLTVEQAERDGGIRPEFADQVIPIYRKADE